MLIALKVQYNLHKVQDPVQDIRNQRLFINLVSASSASLPWSCSKSFTTHTGRVLFTSVCTITL